jgi:hypothetical protein
MNAFLTTVNDSLLSWVASALPTGTNHCVHVRPNRMVPGVSMATRHCSSDQ